MQNMKLSKFMQYKYTASASVMMRTFYADGFICDLWQLACFAL
jgi:hypothetical protein